MNAAVPRRPLVAANWKMNTLPSDAVSLAKLTLAAIRPLIDHVEVVLCPPAISLTAVREATGDAIALGAQNMHWQEAGAFTGEISGPMIAELCSYVIVGHSERRHLFGETDEAVYLKVRAALRHGLHPIVCVGETLAQRKAGLTHEVIALQTRSALHDLTESEAARVVLAYEPVWAIGTGVAASSADANAVADQVRRILLGICGVTGGSVRILYGGSVTAANAREFLSQPDVDGALVGGASLKPDDFSRIVEAAGRTR